MTQVRPGITPEPLYANKSSSFGKLAHAPVDAGRKGARASVGQSSQPASASVNAASASNFALRCPFGSARHRTLANAGGSPATAVGRSRQRAAITMHTGCCTPWKMRVATSGWWPSGEASMTQISSQRCRNDARIASKPGPPRKPATVM